MSLQWSPGRFVRYIAGNCDSEMMLEDFKEAGLVRNACEYLERCSPWIIPEVDGRRSLIEVPHPDIGGRGRLDIAMKTQRKDQWGLLLEAKWIVGRPVNDFMKEIYADIFRLASLTEDCGNGCKRYMLIAGPRSTSKKSKKEHVLTKLLGHSDFKALCPNPSNKILGRILGTRASKKARTNITTNRLPKSMLKHLKEKRFANKELPTGFTVTLIARWAPTNDWVESVVSDDPVCVWLWEVTPASTDSTPISSEVS